MRAITPVFSVLLIIVLSVALMSFLWLFMTGTFNSLKLTGTSTVSESLTTISSCMKIESVYGNQVSIRNCGKGVITTDTLSAYLDDIPLSVSFSGSSGTFKTFGETNILANINHIYPGEMEGIKSSLSESAIVTGMSIYIKAYDTGETASCKLVIYSDNSGTPQNLLGVTNEISGIDNNWGWRNFIFSNSISLNPGDYWLMPMCDNDVNTEYDTSSPGYDLFGGTYPNFPNPWSGGGPENFRESIYATYTSYSNNANVKTFGKTDVGSYSDSGDRSYKEASRAHLDERTTVISISAYIIPSGILLKAAIYSDNSGLPDVLLTTGSTTSSSTGNSWVNVPINPISLNPGYYWLSIKTDASWQPILMQDDTPGVFNHVWDTEDYSSAWSNPWGSVGSNKDETEVSSFASGGTMFIGEDAVGTVSLSGLWNFNPGRYTLRVTNPRVTTEVPVNAVLPDSAVLALDFEEGSGSIAYDSSPYNNNGILNFNPQWVDDKFGKALSFGGDNYVDVGNDSSINFNNVQDFSFGLWVNYGGPVSWLTPLGNGAQSSSKAGYQFETSANDGSISAFISDGIGRVSKRSVNALNNSQWYYISGIIDRTGRLGTAQRLYMFVDGIQQGSPSDISSIGNLITTDHVSVGKVDNGGQYFKGIIDSVRIFNQALTPDETISLRPVTYD